MLGRQRRASLLSQMGGYARFQSLLFPGRELEAIYFSLSCIENLFRFLYITSGVCVILNDGIGAPTLRAALFHSVGLSPMLIALIYLIVGIFIGDSAARTFEARRNELALKFALPTCKLSLVLLFPVTHLLILVSFLLPKVIRPLSRGPMSNKENVDLLLDEVDADPNRSDSDKEMMRSLVDFHDRIVREVMMPRVDVFGLAYDTPIRVAAEKIAEKGVSRVPVYKENIDSVNGILLYKDLFRLFIDVEAGRLAPEVLDQTVESLIKPPFFTPETKKVSLLLQEFRQKQTHMAIVVDEYGGTEGIVTIEDILEEIVGEIEDEYDLEEEELFIELPSGGWIADARMSLHDVREKFGIEIPQEGEYDTIGGYVFFRAGTIPSRGYRIHHDDFDLEILSSHERKVEKVRIHILTAPPSEEDAD